MMIRLRFKTDIFLCKMANVISIYKNAILLSLLDYMPISQLSNMRTIIGQFIYSRLYKPLNKNNCLYARRVSLYKYSFYKLCTY